jgi:hypothetical protein
MYLSMCLLSWCKASMFSRVKCCRVGQCAWPGKIRSALRRHTEYFIHFLFVLFLFVQLFFPYLPLNHPLQFSSESIEHKAGNSHVFSQRGEAFQVLDIRNYSLFGTGLQLASTHSVDKVGHNTYSLIAP